MVWTGEMARARPSWAICATLVACALVSLALVATTPMVVFSPMGCFCAAPRAQQHARIGKPRAVVRAHAGDHAPRRGIDDVAERVDGDERRDDEAAGQRDGGGADAALHRALHAHQLADRRAGARADVALGDRARRRRRGGRVAAVGVGPDLRVADAEVEQDGRRHDGHAPYAVGKPMLRSSR